MKYALIILVVLAATAALLFWGGSSTTVTAPVSPGPPAAETPTVETTKPTTAAPANPLFSRTVVVRPRPMAGPETNAPREWEAKIEAALTTEGTEAEMSARLLALFPELPPEGQAELAPHLAATAPDADYAGVGNILTNSLTPEDVLDVLLTDLMDRPAATRLNTLLTIARNAEHPKAEDARDMLAALMEQDHGKNWKVWETKIAEWLASHPE